MVLRACMIGVLVTSTCSSSSLDIRFCLGDELLDVWILVNLSYRSTLPSYCLIFSRMVTNQRDYFPLLP